MSNRSEGTVRDTHAKQEGLWVHSIPVTLSRTFSISFVGRATLSTWLQVILYATRRVVLQHVLLYVVVRNTWSIFELTRKVTSFMFGVLKWAIPFYWPYAVAKAILKTPLWIVRNTWKALVAAWNQPKTTLGKWTLRPLYVWIALPGTVPWSLFQIGKLFGFEEELMFMLDGMTAFTASVGVIALDVFGKFAFHALVFAAKLLPLAFAAIG